MAGGHRHGDSRICGATTVVSINTSVFANDVLISVDGNANSHGNGALSASCNHLFVHDTLVVDNGDSAAPDTLCASNVHCNPSATSASTNVIVGD